MNEILNVSHPVPPNEYGIFMMHCQDNQPFTDEEYMKIINGPIAAMEPKLQEELSKVEIISIVDKEMYDKVCEILKNTDWSKLQKNNLPDRENDGFISQCKCHTKHPEDCPLHGNFMKYLEM